MSRQALFFALALLLPGALLVGLGGMLTVWGYDTMPTTRTVDNHVAQLRARLEDDPAQPQFIRTVFGVGYSFVRG